MKNKYVTDIAVKFVQMYKKDSGKLKTLVKSMNMERILVVTVDSVYIRFSKIYRMKSNEFEKFYNDFELLEWEFFITL